MKHFVKKVLQRMLGLERYLYIFSVFIIRTLKKNKKEGDFIRFLNMLPDSGTVIDIGANIGAMTVHLARSLPHAQVVSVEPVMLNYNVLCRVVRKYRLANVTTFALALGESTGSVTMVMPVEGSVRMHGLSHVIHESISEGNEGDTQVCPSDTLDNFVAAHVRGPVTGIKLDVENFEYYVLKGGVGTLKQYSPPVYCELWDNENRQKCLKLMGELGYQVYVQIDKKLVIFDKDLHATQNFFFIPHNSR